MIKNVLQKISLLLFIAATWACKQDHVVYDTYISVNPKGWHADSIADFTITIEDTTAQYAVYLKMRHNNSYAYRNIWFFRTITSKRGVEYTDTINYVLANNMGKWLGSGIGENKHVVMPLRTEALRFNKPGKYQFSFQHGMKDTVLEGITEVGLEVFKKDNDEEKD